jgi:hypothetical protein
MGFDRGDYFVVDCLVSLLLPCLLLTCLIGRWLLGLSALGLSWGCRCPWLEVWAGLRRSGERLLVGRRVVGVYRLGWAGVKTWCGVERRYCRHALDQHVLLGVPSSEDTN